MRLAFLGTPDFAVPSLKALIEAGHEIACVYSQPPKPRGRGQALQPSPVQAFAQAQGLPVRTPASMKDAAEVEAFRMLSLEAAVVVAFGQILTREVLTAPAYGCYNLHASLLPRWRGAAPIQRAIMAGDHMTGVNIMRMSEGLDEGPVVLSETTRIDALDTVETLHDRLAEIGARLLVEAMESVEEGRFQKSDGESLEAVADICATAIQNAHYVERVKQLAYLDGLTGIFNRRFFEMRILEEIDRARRFQTGMAVLMIDIDQFKRLNDEFGHLLGDEVLRQVSSILSQQLRKIDVVCRYGGEEFAIVLSQTNPQHALAVAEKLRRLVANWQFPGVARPVTISAGFATFPTHGTTRDELVKAADAGMYAAKQGGRNRVLLGPTTYKVTTQAASVEASTNS